MGNLESESPRIEILKARLATPVAGIRSEPVTKVSNLRCILESIREKKFQNLDIIRKVW